jgi:OOP family OmpA-OmpF porin
MKDVTWQSVTAVGHTDSIGSAAANRRLSDRRAEVVKGYLTQKGLDPKMIATRGLGPDEPVADNASADGRAQNRRTEVVFQGVRASAP